jgi:hypothetical protein
LAEPAFHFLHKAGLPQAAFETAGVAAAANGTDGSPRAQHIATIHTHAAKGAGIRWSTSFCFAMGMPPIGLFEKFGG